MDKTNDIIKYWFPDDNYHSWWFIPKNNLDQDIFSKFYEKLLNTFNNFDIQKYNIYDSEKLITDIIILDQFSRNINRINNDLNIIEYTKKAYLLSKIWIDNKYYLTEPIKFTVFAFLPIRHLKNKNEIENLILILDEMSKNNPNLNSNKIFQKFKLHSLVNLQNLNETK